MPQTIARKKPGSAKGQPKPMKRSLDVEFPSRLIKAMEFAKIEQGAEVAKRAGCSRAVISNYLSGKSRTVEALLLFAVADSLNVSARWLLTGKGEMYQEGAATPEQMRLLALFDQLVIKELIDRCFTDLGNLVMLQNMVLKPSTKGGGQ